MKTETIGVWGRIKMRGLKNKGLIEMSQDPRTGEYVAVWGIGIERKWLLFNLPAKMGIMRGSKEEISGALKTLLDEKLLAV